MSIDSSAGISWISVLPMRIATPGGATTFVTATPSITVPFFEPRSLIENPCGVGLTEQCLRDTHASVSTTSHVRSLPITTPTGGRSISSPRSGPSTTRSCAACTPGRTIVAFVTRVTSSRLVPQLAADPHPQRVQLDESLSVALIVHRVFFERHDIGPVQAARALASEHGQRPLEDAKPRGAGDRVRDLVDELLQRLALRREPETVVD